MLKLLEEAIAFIEEQNKWIDQIKSCVSETERRNKSFHSIICSTLMKEMEKLNLEKLSSTRQRTKFVHHENVQADDLIANEREVAEIQERNHQQDRLIHVQSFPFNAGFPDGEFELKPNEVEINRNFIPNEEDASFLHNEVEFEYETTQNEEKNKSIKVKEENVYALESDNTNLQSSSYDVGNSSANHKITAPITVKPRKKISKAPRRCAFVHGHEKLNQCTFCQKTFRYKCRLVVHMRRHTGEKPFPCNICNKRFRTNHEMTAHLRTHSVQKPFICEICNKGFLHSGSLRYHKLVHTGEKPFVCDICNKRFRNSGTFKAHKLLHTGEKPFKCSYCEESFKRKQSVIEHERHHTGGQ